MTTPATTRPPLNDTLLTVTSAALTQLEAVWDLPAADLINALYEVLPSMIDTWGTAASSVAADWYDELREMQEIRGQFTAIVKPLANPGGDALAGWGSEPLAAPKPGAQPLYPTEADAVEASRLRVEGGLQKRIVNSANQTVTDSANEDPHARGYMRLTRPGACKFCIMVASRGGIFTKTSSTFACHEHCYCLAVPAWGGRTVPVGPYKPSDKPSTAAERARVRKWIADNL